MCVDTKSSFRSVLSDPSFGKRVLGLHVDEAQCIAQWGDSFRPEYSAIEAIRSLLPVRTPVQATSATMPPQILKRARDTLHIGVTTSFHLNLGNDRPNITWEVRHMSAGKSDFEALAFLLPEEGATKLTKTMVFFDDINVSMKERPNWITLECDADTTIDKLKRLL